MSFKILLANARGMCAGVYRAINTVEKTLDKYGPDKVYVLHEVVHNAHVVADLKKLGAHFVDSLEEVPPKSVLIFSAHGVSEEIERRARNLKFTIIDATCPVVTGIHRKMNLASKRGQEAVVIGHPGHQEVIGTIGQYLGDKSKVHVILTAEDVAKLNIDGDNAFFATQTTLSVDETKRTVLALKERFPNIQGPKTDDTCNATQERQNAVRELAKLCDVVIIAGSANSSNSNRLREVALAENTKAYLIDDSTQFDLKWLDGVKTLGLTAGASAPEYVIDDIIAFLKKHGADSCESVGPQAHDRVFPLPKEI